MNESSEMSDLERLPDWAREAFQSAPQSQAAAPSVLDYRGQTAWPLLVGAATVSTFLPGDLGPESLPAEERRDAESTVLRFAEPSFDGEKRKWSLTSDARKAVLASITTSEIPDLAIENRDQLTAALRDILSGARKKGYESTDMRALEATRLVVSWLDDAKSLNPPSIEDLDRQIELRRLLSPFEHMVGRLPSDGTSPPKDRFFGRTKEIKQLRDYVGVVPPSSLLNFAARAVSNVYHTFTPRDPMSIWGTGGVGKTTLIARFMLEHADAAQARFPFAYLDFDRPTMSARNVFGLLGEMCQQVGAQFSELTAPMSVLRSQLAELSHKFEKNPEEATSILGQYAHQFRSAVENYLSRTESLFEFARPFLLVFDTFEIVQYTPEQVSGLEYFVRAFSLPNEPRLWPRLRLVISGRSKVDEFIVKIANSDVLELGALDRTGSAAMLVAFAADAAKAIKERDALRLVDAIAKAVGDGPRAGVRPLRLRLIGMLFMKEKESSESGVAIVNKLIADLNNTNPSEGLAKYLFVDGILVRRILDHVKDGRVRALADPGLVVRRITPDIIRFVMTRGTSDPAKTPDDLGDAPPAKPWEVTDEEAKDIFEAFKRQGDLVEPYDRGDQTALRHRQDVRRDMLPLIKARRRKRFDALHQLAYDFFTNAARSNPADDASASEALYHGLWLNKDFTELDPFWRDDARIDPAEFEAGSRASVYLRLKSKKGKDTFTAEEIRYLPSEMALEWLASHSEELLKRRRLDDTLATVRVVAGDNFEKIEHRQDLGAVVARLLYRGGLWHDAALLLRKQIDFDGVIRPLKEAVPSALFFSLIRTWATIAGRSAAPIVEIEAIVPVATRLQDPLARIEACAHLEIGLRRAGSIGLELRAKLREVLRGIIGQVPPHQWPREPRILRLIILVSSDVDLVRAFVNATERLPRDPAVVEILRKLSATAGLEKDFKILEDEMSRQIGDTIDQIWRKERNAFIELAGNVQTADQFRAIVAYDHADWAQPLGNALSRSLATDPRPIARAFERLRKLSDVDRAMKRRDGASLVQIAMDEGRLMDVVRHLTDVPPSKQALVHDLVAPTVSDLPWRYPDTASEIAAALLVWHESALLGGPTPEVQPRVA